MKPSDTSPGLPLEQRPFRVLLIAGSNRRQYNCPGADSKARTLMLRLAERLPPEWEIDVEDLGNVYARARIQTCNACLSTSMALCVWPCNCYEKDSKAEPDLMWDLDLYARLDAAGPWAIIGPHNWYGPSSILKQMFDRLVCMNGGNPKEELIDHKNPEKAMALEHAPEWEGLSQNHLEGRTAAFFCYGDEGGDEPDADGCPRLLRHKEYFGPAQEPFENQRDAYAPLVWQCRYSGIEVPDNLWRYQVFGEGKKYSEDQAEDMVKETDGMAHCDEWADAFASFVRQKGKVPPGPHRAWGYQAPTHRWDSLKLGWRDVSMRLGVPPEGSSPAEPQKQGLNKDVTLRPGRSEAGRQYPSHS